MKHSLTILLLVAAFSSHSTAQTANPPRAVARPNAATSNAADTQLDLRLKDFDAVWSTVNERHYDATFGGVDWARVRREYEPRVRAVKSDAEFYRLLQTMLGELKLSHFQIAPPTPELTEAAATEKPIMPGAQYGVAGFDLRIIDGKALITRIEPASPAAKAGLRTGFRVLAIDDRKADELLRRSMEISADERDAVERTTRILSSLTHGVAGSALRLTYADDKDVSREVTLTRGAFNGEITPAFGNFPAVPTEFEARRLTNNVGYIRFNIFVVPLMDRIRTAIRDMADAPGIIFDLRGNPGGVGAMAAGIGGLLSKDQFSLGAMQMRTGYINFIAYPQPKPYAGKVVVITDEMSASTSEIFAAGLQEQGRAYVVGERTAGAALPSIFTKLPSGVLFQFAFADFKTPKGKLLEGAGVAPDRTIKLTRDTLLTNRDLQLEAALDYISKHAGNAVTRTVAN